MSNDKVFVDGLIIKDAPVDFVIAKLSFKVEEFKKFLDENSNNGWMNADILMSKGGKMYSALNEWKPDGEQRQSKPQQFNTSDDLVDNDLPF